MSKKYLTRRARRKGKDEMSARGVGPVKLEITSSSISNPSHFLRPSNTTYYSAHQTTKLGSG